MGIPCINAVALHYYNDVSVVMGKSKNACVSNKSVTKEVMFSPNLKKNYCC